MALDRDRGDGETCAQSVLGSVTACMASTVVLGRGMYVLEPLLQPQTHGAGMKPLSAARNIGVDIFVRHLGNKNGSIDDTLRPSDGGGTGERMKDGMQSILASVRHFQGFWHRRASS